MGVRCYLALGSNLGNRLANLQDALRFLAPVVEVDAVSSLYESDPVGPGGVVPYFNAVCAGVINADPITLLDYVKQVELRLGRRPGPRWGPRPADMDLLLIDGVALNTPDLVIPHPRIAERPFVLRPLAEIAPDMPLPDGRSVRTAAEAAPEDGLRRIAGPEWVRAASVLPPAMRPAIAG